MIAYDLQCRKGHTFEGWFEDHKAFEKQQAQGLVACPVCNDSGVIRLPSKFAIMGQPALQKTPSSKVNADMMARAIVDYVDNNFDNVGADFATEALKIHYGVTEPRNIRGVSTSQEEETLRQEGVEFFKFPAPSDPTPSSSSSDSDA